MEKEYLTINSLKAPSSLGFVTAFLALFALYRFIQRTATQRVSCGPVASVSDVN